MLSPCSSDDRTTGDAEAWFVLAEGKERSIEGTHIAAARLGKALGPYRLNDGSHTGSFALTRADGPAQAASRAALGSIPVT